MREGLWFYFVTTTITHDGKRCTLSCNQVQAALYQTGTIFGGDNH